MRSPGRRSPQLFHVLLKLPLVDLNILIRDNLRHFGFRQTEPQDFQRVVGRLTVGQLLLAVLHVEQVHVVGVAETAHSVLGR